MIIRLQPGDKLKVKFSDKDGFDEDGEFEIHFDTKKHKGAVLIKETAGLPGSVIGRGFEILYHEQFDNPPDKEVASEFGKKRKKKK